MPGSRPGLTRVPPVPKGLSPRAAEHWRRLARDCIRLRTLRTADLHALELLAGALATEQQARELLDSKGLTVETAAGGVKPHPAVRMAETARAQAIALLDRFGLNPRSRVGVPELWDERDFVDEDGNEDEDE